MEGFFAWIESWPLSQEIATSVWLFPAVESFHVVALVFVVGSIMRVDLRLLGLIYRDRPITKVEEEFLPWTWTSFVVAVIFGGLLFTSRAVFYTENFWFLSKMVLFLLIFINMRYFQKVILRDVAQWDRDAVPPFKVRLMGALSLFFWTGVVVSGRFVGFT